jgi:hypothetical protein
MKILCWQNVQLLNVKVRGTYSYHCAPKREAFKLGLYNFDEVQLFNSCAQEVCSST